jgi:hypothetical protein
MFLLGVLIFKGLTARRLYTSFGVKGLNLVVPIVVTRFIRNNYVSAGRAYVLIDDLRHYYYNKSSRG